MRIKGIVRSLVLAIVIAGLLVVAFGCQPKAAQKVKVSWWHLDTEEDLKNRWDAMAQAYMTANPNVEIEITVLENEAFKSKVGTLMQSGNPPDLFRSWGGGVMNEYAKAGLLKDITPDLQSAWGESIAKGSLGVYAFDGKSYGVPYDMGMVGLWYNKEIFAKAGLKPFATWSELIDGVKKLKKAGITPIALGEGDKWPGHFWWVYLAVRLGGKEAFDKAYGRTGSFNDAPFVEAGKKLLELVDLKPFQDGFLGATYGDQSAAMGNGKAAMELMGQWAPYSQIQNSESKVGIGDKLGLMMFPMVDGGKGKITDAMGGGNGYIVGKNAPKEAVDFLKFLTNLENNSSLAEAGKVIPVVKGAEAAIKDPLMKEIASQLAKADYFQLYYDQYLAPAVGEAVKDATQGLFAKTLTAEKAAAMIEDAMASAK